LSNPAADVWLAFGAGKWFRHIHVNAIYNALGKHKFMALPVFHSFTGCDTTSAFFGKGKKSAWDAWNSFPEVTDAFLLIDSHPHTLLSNDNEHFKLLERLSCMTRQATWNPSMRLKKEMFCQKNRTMESIPPT